MHGTKAGLFTHRFITTDNITLESFNGSVRQEYLNEDWFMSLGNVRCKIGS
ncbi:integrase core domain-containing protein [Serratia rhizosphaerae]|uniref:integrase core domain-containing protein n=1 Tax=Serratia sp. Tan611 TaxID=2773264 RepID=UPI00193247D9